MCLFTLPLRYKAKMQNFPTFFEATTYRSKRRSDNKVLQVKADNTSYMFTFPFVLQPTAEMAKSHKTDSNSLCYSFFSLFLSR